MGIHLLNPILFFLKTLAHVEESLLPILWFFPLKLLLLLKFNKKEIPAYWGGR